MIKPIKISPVNISKHLFFKCSNCGKEGTIYLENSLINTDNNGNALEPLDYDCIECGKPLNTAN